MNYTFLGGLVLGAVAAIIGLWWWGMKDFPDEDFYEDIRWRNDK